MVSFFRRLFSDTANRDAARSFSTERDWYRARCEELVESMARAETRLSREIARNRKREDALMDQLLMLGGGRSLPRRDELDGADANSGPNQEQMTQVTQFTQGEESILRERAREILEYTHGENFTNEMLENAYQQIIRDPEHYLTN